MRFDRQAKFALFGAALALVLAGVGFRAAIAQLNIYLQKEPVPIREGLANIPSSLGPWRRVGEDQILSEAIVEELGTRQYLNRTFVRDARSESARSGAGPGETPRRDQKGTDAMIALHIAYYTGMIDAIPHVPERCWVAGGMVLVDGARIVPLTLDTSAWGTSKVPPNRATGRPYQTADAFDSVLRRFVPVHVPVGEFAIRAMEFQDEARPDQRMIGGYFFIANGRVTSSALDVRKLAFQRTDPYAYYTKVQFAMPARADDDRRWERFQEYTSEFLDELLPHLMRSLPDWPEVEARGVPGSAPTAKTTDN